MIGQPKAGCVPGHVGSLGLGYSRDSLRSYVKARLDEMDGVAEWRHLGDDCWSRKLLAQIHRERHGTNDIPRMAWPGSQDSAAEGSGSYLRVIYHSAEIGTNPFVRRLRDVSKHDRKDL